MTDSSVVACRNCGRRNRVPAATERGTPRCAQCHQPLPWIVDADDATFATTADQSSIPVLVDLWAPWCGPCRIVSPALEELAGEYAGRVKLVKVDVDQSPATSQRFQAQSIPTLLVMHDGQVVDRQIGAASIDALRAWLERALMSTR